MKHLNNNFQIKDSIFLEMTINFPRMVVLFPQTIVYFQSMSYILIFIIVYFTLSGIHIQKIRTVNISHNTQTPYSYLVEQTSINSNSD